ncbi:Ig-like domain-containing protein [Vibrio agarivorans]|uniref:Ig-like domain-containing protein n=1 Tax=Vibrio agarivorans TaxID=153622 RepID=UPI002230AE12|nr:Ig-like domain-containing protein [Vibrio agarivorans]
MNTVILRTIAALSIVMLTLVGCNDNSGAGVNERELKVTLVNPIEGMNNTLTQGIEGYFTAVYVDNKSGQQIDVTNQVEWYSTDSNTVIKDNGTFISQEGATETNIYATYLDAYTSDHIEVTIIAPDNESLTFRVQPGVYHVKEETEFHYRAFVEFSYQGRVFEQDVTYGTHWSNEITQGANSVVICNADSNIPECEGRFPGFTSTDVGEAIVEVTADHPLAIQHTNSVVSKEWLFISEDTPFSEFSVSVNNDKLYKKQSAQSKATVLLKEQLSEEDVTELVFWKSSNPDVATVNSVGEIVAHSAGTTNIEASISSQISGSVRVEVLPYDIVSIEFNDSSKLTLPTEQRSKENYQVLAYYSDNSDTPINITNGSRLSSTDDHVARAFISGSSFYIKAGSLEGVANIQAHYEDFKSPSITVNVEQFEITGIRLEGLNNQIEVGNAETFNILAEYNDGFDSHPLGATRLLVSFDGLEESPYLEYEYSNDRHMLKGIAPTTTDVDVRFSYIAPDLQIHETSVNIHVIEPNVQLYPELVE